MDEKELRAILANLLEFLEVIPVDLDVLKKGLRSNHKDFEDAIQYSCALEHNLTTIITRNLKDYKKATIKVLTPETFLTKP